MVSHNGSLLMGKRRNISPEEVARRKNQGTAAGKQHQLIKFD